MRPKFELTPWSEITPILSAAPVASAEESVQRARELRAALPSTSALRHGSASVGPIVPNAPHVSLKAKKIKASPQDSKLLEGGKPLPFVFQPSDWFNKTPKAYLMEYFQRFSVPEPKWNRLMTKDNLHKLVSCTFQDPLHGMAETEIHADQFFHTMKEADHNTAILVLLHLIPQASSPKDIQDYMNHVDKVKKVEKKQKLQAKGLRLEHYKDQPKPFSEVKAPSNLYPIGSTVPGTDQYDPRQVFDCQVSMCQPQPRSKPSMEANMRAAEAFLQSLQPPTAPTPQNLQSGAFMSPLVAPNSYANLSAPYPQQTHPIPTTSGYTEQTPYNNTSNPYNNNGTYSNQPPPPREPYPNQVPPPPSDPQPSPTPQKPDSNPGQMQFVRPIPVTPIGGKDPNSVIQFEEAKQYQQYQQYYQQYYAQAYQQYQSQQQQAWARTPPTPYNPARPSFSGAQVSASGTPKPLSNTIGTAYSSYYKK